MLSTSRSLTATQIHAIASLPAPILSTLRNLCSMGYSLKQAYALAVRSSQA